MQLFFKKYWNVCRFTGSINMRWTIKLNTMHRRFKLVFVWVKNSLICGLGGEGGTAGLGGKLLHGRPILEGGLSPDGFGSAIFYIQPLIVM